MRRGLLVSFGLAFVGLFWVSTVAVAEDGGHAAHGTVKIVDVAAGTVTIDHEDIPGLMMGMAMKFTVTDPKVLSGIEPGQVVDFRVRNEGDRYLVTEIRPAAVSPNGHGGMKGMMAPAGK